MKDSSKRLLLYAGAGVGLSYATYKAISESYFRRVFKRHDRKEEVEPQYNAWLAKSSVNEVEIRSFDGLKLNAYRINNHDTKKYVIMVHGIWSSKLSMLDRAYEFDQLGYNLLLVDQRSSGKSEGEYYTYGQKESLDLLKWIDYLSNKIEDVEITLYGLSMGAATVMMATRGEVRNNVKSIIEDCGYSSLKEELDHVLRKDDNLKFTAPVLSMFEKMMLERFGMNFDDCSPKLALESNDIPILFIHGEDDDFVPYAMEKILYNHNRGPKKYYSVKGKKHTECCQEKNYYMICDSFIKSCNL